jgi:predicted RNA binding protein YcfA (HicA-like mRNA interferase family)
LVKRLEKAGFVFARHGGRHDVYKRARMKSRSLATPK